MTSLTQKLYFNYGKEIEKKMAEVDSGQLNLVTFDHLMEVCK